MTPTALAHPLFANRFINFKARWLAGLANRFLSFGAIGYYLQEEGINSRLHLYNYYAHLSGGSFRARWSVRCYSPDGGRSVEQTGFFSGHDAIALELGTLTKGLGSLGIFLVRIDPAEGSRTLNRSFTTIFFTEYATPRSRVYIHSMGHPVPKLYNANDYLVTSIKPEGEPFLIVGNACYRSFHYPALLSQRRVVLTVTNHQGESRSAELDPIKPLACTTVYFRKLWGDLDSFLEAQPGILRVRGPNVLYSPLFVQKGRDGFLALDHFQGLDWDDL